MNVFLDFDVRLDESDNTVCIYLKRSKKSTLSKLSDVELVRCKIIKRRFWYTPNSLNALIVRTMNTMLKDYFAKFDDNMSLRKFCKELSRESYNVTDINTLDFLRKNGIKC